ncbi:hypothetical protein BGX38DRAFT_568156 [Terfezia claveryi]|nr:hypothetical protein BGX38DRAFT_568156 [Terfezia claveryi]
MWLVVCIDGPVLSVLPRTILYLCVLLLLTLLASCSERSFAFARPLSSSCIFSYSYLVVLLCSQSFSRTYTFGLLSSLILHFSQRELYCHLVAVIFNRGLSSFSIFDINRC